jgi:hypothetical protein
METIKILELPLQSEVEDGCCLPIANPNGTGRVTIAMLKRILSGQDGYTPQKGVDYTDGKDGVSIVSVEQTTQSHVSGGLNVLTIKLSDGTQTKFVVRNAESCNGSHELGGTMVRIGEVTLLASDWVGSSNAYSQIVNIEGVTKYTQVDLTPSVEQLVTFYEKDLSFVTENEGGVVTVYAIGQKPMNDYTIQVTMTEVIYE